MLFPSNKGQLLPESTTDHMWIFSNALLMRVLSCGNSIIPNNMVPSRHIGCTLHVSSDPIPIFSSYVAQIGYGPRPCKQENKSHGFRYSAIGFRPHSYVEINQIWYIIRQIQIYNQTNWIFPCKCDSYVIEKWVVFFYILRYRHTCNKWNLSSWVAEY